MPCSVTTPAALMRAIVADAAYETGVAPDRIIGPDRTPPATRARFATTWTMRRATASSYAFIAGHLGGRHYTTLLHAVARADGLRASDPAFRTLTDRLLAAANERKSA